MAEAAAWRAAEIVKLRVVRAVGFGGRFGPVRGCTLLESAPKATPRLQRVGSLRFGNLISRGVSGGLKIIAISAHAW